MFSAERAPGDGQRRAVDLAGAQQLAQHGRHAAGAMEAFAQVFAGGLHVHQQRDVPPVFHPVGRRDFDARVARHRDQVRLRIGRTANRGDGRDGIEERLAREDLRRTQILVGQLDDALAGFVGDLAALAVRRGNRGAAGQRQPEHFGDGVHRGRGAHRVAVTERGRRCGRGGEKLLLVDLTRGEFAARAPDHRARADQFAVMPAIEHRSAGQHDGGNVDGRRRHDLRGRGLVAAGGQHHGVDRIAVQDFDEAEIGEIAIERGRRPAAILEDRMQRKFHGHAARVADALAHALHGVEVHAVAGREIAAGLRDADDGSAGQAARRP